MMSDHDSLPSGVRYFAVPGLLIVHTILLAWAATRHSPSVDETAHLPAGISHWALRSFQLYAVNPPLVRRVAALPVLLSNPQLDWSRIQENTIARSEFEIGSDFVTANGERAIWLYTIGRWGCIPFSLLGGWICFLWAREIYGWPSGLLALGLWCFSPTILANAQMLTPDVGAAALGVAAGYLFHRWLRSPTWRNAFLAGVGLGFAEMTKFTWVVLFGLWPLLWLLRPQNPLPRLQRKETIAELSQLAGIFMLAIYVINMCYEFDGSFQRLGEYRFASKALRGNSQTENRFRHSLLGEVPVPLPREYVIGIDVQKKDFENKIRSYLLGEWRQDGGWWYYYLVALAVKVPLGAWGLIATAFILRLTRFRNAFPWFEDVVLLAPGLVILLLVSSQTGFNHHMRYVLPMFPFVMIWMSQVAHAIEGHRVRQVIVCGASLWFAGSSLWYYPHSLSYFNELAGGPLNGHRVLVDSNIDWGQDLLYLKSWLDEHPEARPLGLAYFGQFDPRILGIEYSLPPLCPEATKAEREPDDLHSGPLPGWYAVSVSTLQGLHFPLYAGDGTRRFIGENGYAYFQEFKPVARAGYSIYIYHLGADDVNSVRRRLGLRPVGAEEAERGADAAELQSDPRDEPSVGRIPQ